MEKLVNGKHNSKRNVNNSVKDECGISFQENNIYQMFFFYYLCIVKKKKSLFIKGKPFNLSMYEKDYVY